MKLYVVMVTLNCLYCTQQTLGSFKTNIPHNFVIVDNASTDGTQTLLNDLSAYPNQIHIKNASRVSVTKAWNQGLEVCLKDPEFKYVYVINNDIVFEPCCVDELVRYVEEHPRYALVSGINTRDHKFNPNQIIEPDCDFSAFLLTRECVEKVGLFDENFVGAYFEDNDYHHRVHAAGLKSCMVSNAKFFHVGSRTINEGLTGEERLKSQNDYNHNKEYFRSKWGFVP